MSDDFLMCRCGHTKFDHGSIAGVYECRIGNLTADGEWVDCGCPRFTEPDAEVSSDA